MDVNWFFLLILHNQALLKVTFGSWVFSALTTVAFSQMVTSTPPRGINLQMSFKKTCLMQREQRALVSSSAKGLSAAKGNETKNLQGWKMALGDALTQQELWHVLSPFSFSFFGLVWDLAEKPQKEQDWMDPNCYLTYCHTVHAVYLFEVKSN